MFPIQLRWTFSSQSSCDSCVQENQLTQNASDACRWTVVFHSDGDVHCTPVVYVASLQSFKSRVLEESVEIGLRADIPKKIGSAFTSVHLSLLFTYTYNFCNDNLCEDKRECRKISNDRLKTVSSGVSWFIVLYALFTKRFTVICITIV